MSGSRKEALTKRPPPKSKFLASTPAVSPSQKFNYDGGAATNVNHVALAEETNCDLTFVDARRNPPTPVRVGTGHPETRTQLHLSPIDRLEEDKLIYTLVHRGGNDTTLPVATAARTGNPRSVYPFPTPKSMKREPRDKYELVLEGLQLLKCFESMQDTDGITEQQDSSSNIGRKNATGNAAQTQKEFEFTEDMFKTSNSEAFIAVTHFLFDMLDKTESVHRFRNAWPIYEKKQESLYRRAALEWFKEIVTDNPNFFPRNCKIEQLQGLVVNPYGDRFIRFLNGFVNFVIHQVSIMEDDIGDPILLPPVFTGNPEVTKRQVLIRENRIEVMEKQIKTCEIQRTVELMDINELTAKIQRIEKETAQELLQRKSAVAKLIETQPEIFPEDAAVMLSEEGDFIRKEFKLIPIADHQKAFHEIQSPLYKHVHAKWMDEVKSLGGKVAALIDFFQKNSRLYTLLQATSQKRISMDVHELELPQELKEKEDLSISDILEFYGDVAKMCFNQVNEAIVSPEIISRKKNLENKLNLLRKRSQDIGAMENLNKADLKKQTDFEIQKLSIKLENADWSEFSEFHGMQLSSLFKFSPPRHVDTAKITGLTPAVSGYLPEIAPTQGVGTLNQSKQDEVLHISRNSILGDRSFKQSNIVRDSLEQIISVVPVRQDICVSPISHLSSKTIEPLVLLHSRNSRRSSLSKFRLSLPPSIEDDEHLEKEETYVNSLGNKAVVEENETVQGADTTDRSITDSLDRMNELRKCFASASIETPMEQPLQKVKARRRSSLNLKGKNVVLDSTFNESSIEDLEGLLGIMDVTLSYGDFLDVSIDCDEDETS